MRVSKNKQFHRDALLYAWMNDRKFQNAHSDLADYYGAVATAFEKAFRANLDEPQPSSERVKYSEEDDPFLAKNLYDLFLDFVRLRESCVSPFSGMMCAPKEFHQIYKTFNSRLSLAQCQLIGVYDEILVALIGRIWGIESTKAVSLATLKKHGYPESPEPDPLDYG